MGIDLEGERDILGMWIGSSGGKGAKFWHSVLTELANRGITDALVVCCDGLKGLPEAIRTSWPLAERSTTWWVRLRSLPVGLFGRGAILQKSHKTPATTGKQRSTATSLTSNNRCNSNEDGVIVTICAAVIFDRLIRRSQVRILSGAPQQNTTVRRLQRLPTSPEAAAGLCGSELLNAQDLAAEGWFVHPIRKFGQRVSST